MDLIQIESMQCSELKSSCFSILKSRSYINDTFYVYFRGFEDLKERNLTSGFRKFEHMWFFFFLGGGFYPLQ